FIAASGIAGGLLGHLARDFLPGRVAAGAGVAAGLAAGEVNVVGHDLERLAVVAVLVLIGPGLDAAVYGDQRTFLEILANKLGTGAPADDVDEIGLPLFTLAHEAAIHRNGE